MFSKQDKVNWRKSITIPTKVEGYNFIPSLDSLDTCHGCAFNTPGSNEISHECFLVDECKGVCLC